MIATPDRAGTLDQLVTKLQCCTISGLSEDEARERAKLEEKRRELSGELEKRRKYLGTKARKGALGLGPPFKMVLNWWEVQNTDDDDVPAKTWAGRQEMHKVARACQDSLAQLNDTSALLDFEASLRVPKEYQRERTSPDETIEAFYFDARRFAHALDVGYSLDVLDANTVTYPGVELLCLIGLQRFRPKVLGPNLLLYQCWSTPLPCAVAPIASSAAFADGIHFHFRRRYRDDQKRYKAFDFATQKGASL